MAASHRRPNLPPVHVWKRTRPFQSRQRAVYYVAAPVAPTPDGGTLVLTGFAPTVSTPVLVTPAKASLVLSEFAPAVATPRLVTPGKASLTLTEFAPSVATPRLVSPANGALTLTGFDPAVTATANRLLTPAAAALSLTGTPPKVTAVNPPVRVGGVALPVHVSPVAPYYRPPGQPSIYQEQVQPAPPVAPPTENRPAITALYMAGALSDEEFVALLAA